MKKNMVQMLTQSKLKEILYYNPDIGIFIWKRSFAGPIKAGDPAGFLKPNGYIQIKINQMRYYAHRLAWLYINGNFPEKDMDHINRIRNDNRWKNLRCVSKQCNARNSKMNNRNTSGVTGVIWAKRDLIWRANLYANGKIKNLGSFKKLKDAVKARWSAEKDCHYYHCNATSSACQYLKENNLI